uniref:Uncharacterized protein LOC111105274 isoform X1 n=1 Tax=Crassostrea virginica TaxID=6565 RepID=A0A8B8AVP0_CRAVI|nr:uncharacterized protein LOC111105274 isoform X1 [Crassostrea virginica]
MKYQILQCFFLILYSPNSVTSFNCSRNSKEMCLTDCSWSTEENKCKDCPPGFYGIKCLSLCRYPNYGDNCQQDCSNCSEQQCDSVFGCLTGTEKDHSNEDHLLAIGIPVGFGVVIVIAVFIVITITNRRFFAGHMRQNALYVGSVVAEHCVSTDIYRPEPTSSDSYNDIYSVVNTIRRPNVSNLAFRKKENEWN